MCSAGGLLFSQSDPFLPPEVSSDDITVNEVMAALQETARRMSTGAVFQGSSRMIHGSMGRCHVAGAWHSQWDRKCARP